MPYHNNTYTVFFFKCIPPPIIVKWSTITINIPSSSSSFSFANMSFYRMYWDYWYDMFLSAFYTTSIVPCHPPFGWEVPSCQEPGMHIRRDVKLPGRNLVRKWNHIMSTHYEKYNVEECQMGFRLQTRMLDCRGNMPTRYRRDMTCRACQPDSATGMAGEEETQEHLEVCLG